jgi:hypothetical protein
MEASWPGVLVGGARGLDTTCGMGEEGSGCNCNSTV